MKHSSPATGISTARLILDAGISPALMSVLSVRSDTPRAWAASFGLSVIRSSNAPVPLRKGDCQWFTWYPLYPRHIRQV